MASQSSIPRNLVRLLSATLLPICLAVFLPATPTAAHDVPEQVKIKAIVKPEDRRLTMVARIPLEMLLNMNLPKRGPGFLALDRIEEPLDRAARIAAKEIVVYQNGELLAPVRMTGRISRLSDRSFDHFDTAVATITGPPLPVTTDVFWNQGYFDVLFEYNTLAAERDFAIELRVAPGLRNILSLSVVYLSPDGDRRVHTVHGDAGPVHLDPTWLQVGRTFATSGFWHIFDGVDHLLFLLCLILPFGLRRLRETTLAVTTFAIGHMITLTASALGLSPDAPWFTPFVETVIAGSILYLAIENAVRKRIHRRWLACGIFGLFHGLGFAGALEETLAQHGTDFEISIVAFTLGLETAQLTFVIAGLTVLSAARLLPTFRTHGVLVLSVLAAHEAWHWVAERFDALTREPGPTVEGLLDARLLGLIGVIITTIGIGLIIRRNEKADFHRVRLLSSVSTKIASGSESGRNF